MATTQKLQKKRPAKRSTLRPLAAAPAAGAAPSPDDLAAEWIAPDKLTPWKDNPRLNTGEPVRKVIDSIKRFGFSAPIVARAENLEIIAGHTRWLAARALGLKRVPVRLLNVTESEAHLLALTDNRLGELAEWSPSLADMLTELGPIDMQIAGWNAADLDRLTAELLSAAKLEDDAQPRLDRPGAATGERLTVCPNCGVSLK